MYFSLDFKVKAYDSLDSPKQKITKASLDLFSLYGYKNVSTREIVRKADVNISAIAYYFGGKENLYKEVIQEAIKSFDTYIDSSFEKIFNKKIKTQKKTKKILFKLLSRYIDYIFLDENSKILLMLLLREIGSPSFMFNTLCCKITNKICEISKKLTSTFVDETENSKLVVIPTFLILGQISTFYLFQDAILKQLRQKKYDQDIIEKLKEAVFLQLENIIDLYWANRNNS